MDTAVFLGHEYHPRVIDGALHRALDAAGAVVIEGPRAAGKTMTGMHAAASCVFVDDPHTQDLIGIAPHQVLAGDAPRLLDEWQVAPVLWNLVRRAVDAASEPGQYILTGSAVPDDDATRHTGAGRFLRIRQRTMTWWERNPGSVPAVSLTCLFAGEHPSSNTGRAPSLDDVIEMLLQSGFPAMSALNPVQVAARLRGYLDEVARTDIHRLADVRHEPNVIKALLTALSRSVASEVTYSTLVADLKVVAPRIDPETVSKYVELLERLFIVERQSAWTPALRSRARLRTSPKFHLADPALAAVALGAGTPQLAGDLATLGTLFESAVVHDLNVYASALGGEVRHYRDSNGNEIDAIVSLPDGRWGAVEIKLGGRQLAMGSKSLNKALGHIDIKAVGEPVFRLVVTGTGPIMTIDDGTISAPLHALAP